MKSSPTCAFLLLLGSSIPAYAQNAADQNACLAEKTASQGRLYAIERRLQSCRELDARDLAATGIDGGSYEEATETFRDLKLRWLAENDGFADHVSEVKIREVMDPRTGRPLEGQTRSDDAPAPRLEKASEALSKLQADGELASEIAAFRHDVEELGKAVDLIRPQGATNSGTLARVMAQVNKFRAKCSVAIADAETGCKGEIGAGSLESLEPKLSALGTAEAKDAARQLNELRGHLVNFGSFVDRMREVQSCREAVASRPALSAKAATKCPEINVSGAPANAPGAPEVVVPGQASERKPFRMGICLDKQIKYDECAPWLGGLRPPHCFVGTPFVSTPENDPLGIFKGASPAL